MTILMLIALIGCSTSKDAAHERETEGSTLRQRSEKGEDSERIVGGGHLKPLLQNARGADAASALEVFQQRRTRADEVTQVLIDKVATFERRLTELAPRPGIGPGRPRFADSRRTIDPGTSGHEGIYLIPTARNWVVVAGEAIEPIFISSLVHGVMWDLAFEVRQGQRIPETLVGIASDDVKSVSVVGDRGAELVTVTTIKNTIFAPIPRGPQLEDLKQLKIVREDGSSEFLRIHG